MAGTPEEIIEEQLADKATDNVPDYSINYDDPQFQKVQSDQTAALEANDKLYDSMVSGTDKFYQDQIDAAKEYNQQQIDLQNQQTDLAIQEIEQNKQKTERDYQKEQTAAYVDWQKQKDDYGVNAEQEAANGLRGSGYSESSQVSFYNTYQNRVAKARESFQDSVQKFELSITQARLQNNVKLAELAYQTLQKSLELALQMFQNKNQLLLDQANKKLQIESLYEQRRQSVLDQINKENSLAEQIRQFNASMANQEAQLQLQRDQLEENKRQFDTRYGGGSGGGTSRSYTPRSSKDSYTSDRKKTTLDDVSKAMEKVAAPRSTKSDYKNLATTLDSAVKQGTITKSEAKKANALVSGAYKASNDNSLAKEFRLGR